ncbi:MAG TPA: ABC transporter substrate-binding protein, partial [Candidatus Binatia bacterium]
NSAVNARVAPLWIARDQGFFKKYGTEVDLVLIRSGPLQVASLAAGDSDVGYSGASTVLGAAANGADLKILASFTNKITYDLVARPGIKTPADLRGKRVGVQAIGGTVWMGAMLGLEHLGLEPSRDRINIMVIGDQAVLTQGLVAGVIDATVLDGVYSRALQAKGFPILAEFGKNNIPFGSSGIVVRQAYLDRQSAALESIIKALIEADAFIHAPDRKSAIVNTLRGYLKINEHDAEEGYKDNLAGLDLKPYPSVEGVRNIQRLMKTQNPKIEKVRVENLIDDRILRKLDESGFIDELFRKYGVK